MNTSSGSARPDRPLGRFLPNPKLRFLDQCREVWRFKHMARRTEEACVDWIRRFIAWARDHPHFGTGAEELRTRNLEPGTWNLERGTRRDAGGTLAADGASHTAALPDR